MSQIDQGYNPSSVVLEPPKHNGIPYDSVIGEVTPFGSNTSYTSVTVYNTDQIYPEYLFYYNRTGTAQAQPQMMMQMAQQPQQAQGNGNKVRAIPK